MNVLRLLRVLLPVVLLVSLPACVDRYNPELNLSKELLVIDGILTDQPEPQRIRLYRSRSTQKVTVTQPAVQSRTEVVNTPVAKARVEVVVNGGAVLTLRETEAGTYQLPEGFRGKPGDRYQLRFQTAEGGSYESSVETMTAAPPIGRAYDQFNPRGVSNATQTESIPTNDVYVDFQDPAAERNFYLWRWTQYESQDWCVTCRQGLYYLTDTGTGLTGDCRKVDSIDTFNDYDYTCLGFCWDIFYSQGINIFADVYANGRPQVGRLVAQIPLYQSNACLVVIQQYSLSADAYRYYKLLQDQTQNTGTLADTPPAPTAGNVRNVADPNESVVGYFSASAVALNRYWLDRKNTTGGRRDGLFYSIKRRLPVEEPPLLYRAARPSSVCMPSRTRTPDRPLGWQ